MGWGHGIWCNRGQCRLLAEGISENVGFTVICYITLPFENLQSILYVNLPLNVKILNSALTGIKEREVRVQRKISIN